MPKMAPEVRWSGMHEIRAEDGKLSGYAAVFDSWSVDLGGFRERITPGAFKKTLQEKPDVRALLNHDSTYILGRTKNGTLKLREDEYGLRMELDPSDTSYGRDLIELVRRGDVDGMSFGFRVVNDSWDMVEDQLSRSVHEVELIEVSAVTFPAYPATQLSARGFHLPTNTDLRSYLSEIGADVDQVMDLIEPPAPEEDHAGRTTVDMALRHLKMRRLM
jgi:HK97 family phage prohead protease